MRPAIDALARDWRVITSSLPGEPGSDGSADGDFEALVRHVDGVLDHAAVPDAVVCGVSFGGLIALRYAARRPGRVRALILVSTPGPRWQLDAKLVRYLKWPRLNYPFFLAGSIGRFWPELRAAYPELRARLGFCAHTLTIVLSAPAAPSRMSQRVRLIGSERFESDCAHIVAPTLIVSGERDLDHVVAYEDTMDYLTVIRGSSLQIFEKTGHLGIISAPDRFAAIVSRFVRSA
jgi:pimeloyl-ACP methyl ester carboxylesterase